MTNTGVSTTTTMLQTMPGEPLRSEQRMNQYFPRILSRLDMILLYVLFIVFFPHLSAVQVVRLTGPFMYLYWGLAFLTFLVPRAIVTAQLNRLIHANGSIYVWTQYALGGIWSFVASLCSWFPGIFIIIAAGASALTALQYIGKLIFGPRTHWLELPWEQGLVILMLVMLSGALALLPLPTVIKLIKGTAILHLLGLFMVGLAGVAWLLSGHTPQLTETAYALSGLEGILIFGFFTIALLGLEVPLNMAAEVRQRDTMQMALRWGTLLIGAGYLIGMFGITTVLSLQSSEEYTTLQAILTVFGKPAAIAAAVIIFFFFLCSAVIYNIAFARILFAMALDHRLPSSLIRVNRHAVPVRAINLQTGIVLLIIIVAYLIVPLFVTGSQSVFALKMYIVMLAMNGALWLFSLLFLFVDLPVLLYRHRSMLNKVRGHLLLPSWALCLCCLSGLIATLTGIMTVFVVPLDPMFSRGSWTVTLVVVVGIVLFLGFLAAAYPRLWCSIQEQTAVARENARLYEELRVAYEKLYQLDQLKDSFLSTVSHELRTPVTIVQGYIELLGEMEEQLDAGTRQMFVNNARRACDELAILLANVMDASTLHIDTAALRCTNLSLKKVCKSVMDLFEPIILQQERYAEVDIPEEILVWADETRLKQVLRNLISNALRYSPLRTPLFITATIDHECRMVRTNIIDRGAGVPVDKQALIFERFVRLERDMHGDVRGSGLGLAICSQLIDAMHGTISVQSNGIKGEGSTFSFTLPLGL
jgi:signal transduction histidine kinase